MKFLMVLLTMVSLCACKDKKVAPKDLPCEQLCKEVWLRCEDSFHLITVQGILMMEKDNHVRCARINRLLNLRKDAIKVRMEKCVEACENKGSDERYTMALECHDSSKYCSEISECILDQHSKAAKRERK